MEDRFFGFHLDFLGFVASFICAIHCAIGPLLLTLGMLGGLSWISDPIFELGFLVTSLTIAAFTLVNGYRKQTIDRLGLILFTSGFSLLLLSSLLPHVHGVELVFAVFGGLTVASAHIYHWLNLRRTGCVKSA